MSVLLICSACQDPHTLIRLPVSRECSRCGVQYPQSAYELAVQTLCAEAVPRPLLLTLGMGFCAFWSVLAAIITVTTLVSDGGSYEINGQPVSREEFLREPIVLLFPLAILYTGAVSWALYREQPWTRPLMLAAWLTYVLVMGFAGWPGTTERIVGVVLAIFPLGIASWYLYGKPNVVAYYERLAAQAAARTA